MSQLSKVGDTALETHPSFLDQCTQTTEQMEQQILYASSLNALLLTNLPSDAGSAPDVQDWDELGQCVHDTALAQLFCVLAEGVAWDKVGDDACNTRRHGQDMRRACKKTSLTGGDVTEARAKGVRPVVRHLYLLKKTSKNRNKTDSTPLAPLVNCNCGEVAQI